MLCDVVEMDAFHIFLGIPWIFDWKMPHDGRENSYKFVQKGQHYKLTTMPEDVESCSKGVYSCNNNIMLCYERGFLKQQRKSGWCLDLLP